MGINYRSAEYIIQACEGYNLAIWKWVHVQNMLEKRSTLCVYYDVGFLLGLELRSESGSVGCWFLQPKSVSLRRSICK